MANCCDFVAIDPAVINVVLSFQYVSGWKLRKIVKDLEQVQKGNTYKLFCILPDSVNTYYADKLPYVSASKKVFRNNPYLTFFLMILFFRVK